MLWRHHNDTFSWVDAVYREINVFFCCFQELSGLKKYKWLPKYKVWDKSKTTWAVGITQLTHHSVRGEGKNPKTGGRGIFAPTLNLVVS